MNKKSINVYAVTVLAATAVQTVLSVSAVPFWLAVLYLLPMSLTISIVELVGLESIAAYFIIFIPLSAVLNALVFLPVLRAPRFKTRTLLGVTQIAVFVIYIVISLVVFARTGSWTSV